jgi:hypothetical protein
LKAELPRMNAGAPTIASAALPTARRGRRDDIVWVAANVKPAKSEETIRQTAFFPTYVSKGWSEAAVYRSPASVD